MEPIFLAWLVEIGIIAVRDLSAPAGSRRLPLPSELLAAFVVFGGLSAVGTSATFRRPANLVAWGIVVATFLSAKVDFLKPVGDFMAGKSPLAGPNIVGHDQSGNPIYPKNFIGPIPLGATRQ